MFQPLQKGDAIGIFSPSSPSTVTAAPRFERAKAFLTNKGFRIVEGSLTGVHDHYRSGSPKARAEEFNELVLRDDVKMIMSTIGGTNSNSMLPYIDYEAFKRNPKIVVGYSDATALLLALYAKTNVPTFYGPALIPSFGECPPLVHDTYRYFEQFFCTPTLPYTIDVPAVWSDEFVNWLDFEREKTLYDNEWLSVGEGVFTGRLIGGNNNAMYGTIGSPYFPTIQQGDILLIEDTMKHPSVVEKNMAMLKLHGVFDRVQAILLGKHEQYDDDGTNKQPLQLLLEQLDGRKVPILANIDCAHTHPMFPLAIGQLLTVDVTKKRITYTKHWL